MEVINYTLYVPFGLALTLGVMALVFIIKSFF